MNHEILALGLAAPIVFGAYTVFGITGFGATIVAMPLLVQFEPLSFAVPTMLLLDLLATITLGSRSWREVARKELMVLVPIMFAGILLGTAALRHVSPTALLMCLGVFVIGNSVWALASSGQHARVLSRKWAVPTGLIGGTFSAAFGTGGPIYTIYLIRRIPDVTAFRATIATVILTSALLRTAVFGVAGLLSNARVLWTVLALAPFCLAGVYAGSKVRHKVSPERIRKFILVLLLATGVAVLARALKG